MKEKKYIAISRVLRNRYKEYMHKHINDCGLNTTEVKKISTNEFKRLTGLPNGYDYLSRAYTEVGPDPSAKAFEEACRVIGLSFLPMKVTVLPYRVLA